MITRYSIRDIDRLISSGFSFEFDDDVLKKINSISEEVGAPEYIHTPQFYKKNCQKNLKDEDWELIRNFKTTKMEKKEGVDASIDTIRKYLNKMSKNTYGKLKQSIIDEMSVMCDNIHVDGTSAEELENSDLTKIGNIIFTIASSGAFYSEMYASLYSELIGEFGFMEKIFYKNFDDFSTLFHDIEYYDPTDYDKFCENNKKNERRRAIGLFYVNLMIKDVISQDSILDIIITIQNYLIEQMGVKGAVGVVDELSELIFIMVTAGINHCTGDKWKQIVGTVDSISKLTVKSRTSITNKTIFKHMDMLDAINNS